MAFYVPSANWLQTVIVELAGGEPVWTEAVTSGGWTVVNFEQIAAWDPELIMVVNYFDDPGIAVAELRIDPKWQALRATQEDNIFAFPGDFLSWDQPDTRWILGLQWLATKIQPDRFESLDLLDEVKTFYEEMYGLDAETFESEVLPMITGDHDVKPMDQQIDLALVSRKHTRRWVILLTGLLLVFTISLFVGRYPQPYWMSPRLLGQDELARQLVLALRLPRILAALMMGASLAAAGNVLQMVFRNPLVGPGILGVSQGAGFGAALAILTFSTIPLAVELSALLFASLGCTAIPK